MKLNTALVLAFRRFGKMLAISFVASATTGLTVYQQQAFLPSGTINTKVALAAASTSFLVAFASGVLKVLESLLADSSTVTISSMPKSPPQSAMPPYPLPPEK